MVVLLFCLFCCFFLLSFDYFLTMVSQLQMTLIVECYFDVLLLFLGYLHCFSVVVVFAAADFLSSSSLTMISVLYFFRLIPDFIIRAFFLLQLMLWIWCFALESSLSFGVVVVVVWNVEVG